MDAEFKPNPGIVARDRFGNKDFIKYAYFISKAANHTVIIRPQLEEIMANGEIRVSKDENGKPIERLYVEFHNGMKRFEKSKENEVFINYLRGIIQNEKDLPENKKSIKEVIKPARLYTEEEVKNLLKAQEAIEKIETKKEDKKEDSGAELPENLA
jgi:hypothetical protein